MQSPPCVWDMVSCETGDEESPGSMCPHLDSLSDHVREVVVGAAVGFLWNVTGRKYGTCPVSVRPCAEGCGQKGLGWGWGGVLGTGWYVGPYPFGSQFLSPIIWNGEWINLVCGTCSGRCEHGAGVSSIKLPGPVAEILEVRVDGAVLAPTEYRQDNVGLVRLNGESWPKSQDMSADPLTDPDTFMVTYLRGRAAPPGGQLAAGILACEIAKMVCGDKSCKLPKRVMSIQREGVTLDLIDNLSTMWTKGSVGILLVDMWLASERIGQRGSTQIVSPNKRPFRNGPLP